MKEINEIGQRQIGKPIGIIGKKLILAFEKFLNRLKALADIRLRPGVDKMNAPILDITIQQLDVFATVRKNEVVGSTLAVVKKILLDCYGLQLGIR
jgi:hypothetical protein